MASVQELRRVIDIRSRTTGVKESATDLQKLDRAYTGVTVQSAKMEKATLSVDRQFQSLQRKLDPTVRATERLAQAERTLSAAHAQGLITLARKNQLMGLASVQTDRATLATTRLAAAQRSLGAAGGMALGMAGLGGGAAVGGILAAGFAVSAFVKNSIEAQKTLAQLEAVIKSTGGAAGLTSGDLTTMATEMQRVTTYGDDAVISAQALLLTFTKVGRDVFPDAIRTILDMSTAMGTDLKSSTIQVGKALNDPIKGITALTRVGVTFTEAQKAMITALVNAGDVAGAQVLILRELQTEFGGSAAAARDTLGGALTALGNAFGDLFEVSGEGSSALTKSINSLNDALSDPATIAAVQELGAAIFDVLSVAVEQVRVFIRDLHNLKSEIAGIIEFITNPAGITMLTEVDRLALTLEQRGFENVTRTTDGWTESIQELTPAIEGTTNALDDMDVAVGKVDATMKAGIASANNQNWFDAQTKATKAVEDAAKKAADEATRTAEQRTDAIQRVTEQLAFEEAQLGRSAREQAIYNSLKQAGVTIDTAAGQAIAAAAGHLYDLQAAQKAADDAQKEALKTTEAMIKAREKLVEDIAFERATMFLSEDDAAIANRLRGIYGNDIPAALSSWEAEQIRVNNAMKQSLELGAEIKDSLAGAIAGIFDGSVKSVDDFLDKLTEGIAKLAADELGKRLTDKLFGGALAPVDAAGTQVATALSGAAGKVTAATPPLNAAATALGGAATSLKQAATSLSAAGTGTGTGTAAGGWSVGAVSTSDSLSAAKFNVAAAAAAIKAIESLGSGGYGALGKVIANGDRAYGAYQVMGNNISSWTKAALGYSMTNQQFLASAEAQDKVFANQFGSLVDKFGNVSDAASAWFTGQPLSVGGSRSDINGMTGNTYVDRFNKTYAAGTGAAANDNLSSVNIASVGGKTVADPAEIGGFTSSGAGTALSKLGSVLGSSTFQTALSGFSTGYQSQSAVTGGLTGALTGFMSGGPVGAVVGGISGVIGGILGKSKAEREAAEAAQEAWEAMADEVEAFSKELKGKVTGELTGSIEAAESKFKKYNKAAEEAGESTGGLAKDLETFKDDAIADFKRRFKGEIKALESGLGDDDPYLKSQEAIAGLREELLGLIDDAETAGKSVGKVKQASREYVLSQIGGTDSSSTTAYETLLAEESRIAGTKKESIALLVELGWSEKKARKQVNAAMEDAIAAAQDVYQEAIDARKTDWQDQLFNVTNDTETEAGQLAALEREYQKAVEEEIDAGGEAMLDLEAYYAAARLEIQEDFNDAALEEAERAAEELNSVAKTILEYINDLNSGSNSTLSPQDQLTASAEAYNSQYALAQSGDTDAQSTITEYADNYLNAAREMYASGSQYQDILNAVKTQLLGLPAVSQTTDPTLQALRDILNAQQAQLNATGTLAKDATVSGVAKDSSLSGLATDATLDDVAKDETVSGVAKDTTLTGDADNGLTGIKNKVKDARDSIDVLKLGIKWLPVMAQRLYEIAVFTSQAKGVDGKPAKGEDKSVYASKDNFLGFAHGGVIGAYAPGGIVGNGTWNVDSVRARYADGGDIMLAGGEGVLNAQAMKTIGPTAFDMMNTTGRIPGSDNNGVAAMTSVIHGDLANVMRVQISTMTALIETLRSENAALRAEVRSGSERTTRAVERKPVAKPTTKVA